ncbi:MAG: CheB methylesterase [Verrucomicrobiales bacterium]|nr:CheB methylesterase [Verrucomicrobiales bacterium]
MELGTLTPFTCPECHGALVRILDGPTLRFRCHTGHAYTDSALLEGVMECAGEMLWQVTRTLEESVMPLNNIGTYLKEAGDMGRSDDVAVSHFAQWRNGLPRQKRRDP